MSGTMGNCGRGADEEEYDDLEGSEEEQQEQQWLQQRALVEFMSDGRIGKLVFLCIYYSTSLSTMGIVVLYILQNGRKENSAVCHYSYLHCHMNSRTYLTRNQAHHDT
jgi:hypothetical protein